MKNPLAVEIGRLFESSIVSKTTDWKVVSAITLAWFPAKEVKHGDSIVLYSNAGEHTQEPAIDGTTNHFYHWGFTQTIWQDPAACVVVLDILDWLSTHLAGPAPSLASLGLGSLASILAPQPLPPLPPLGSWTPPEHR